MPFYEYKCSGCGFELEELQRMSDPPLVKCPNCGKDTLQKLIGTGGGLIFKGSGFYLTDYKNKTTSGAKTANEAGTTVESKTAKKDDTKKESKSAEKKTTAPETKKPDNSKKDK